MLKFYWSLGHDIVERQMENTYGSGFFKRLSADLQRELPDIRVFHKQISNTLSTFMSCIRHCLKFVNKLLMNLHCKSICRQQIFLHNKLQKPCFLSLGDTMFKS